MLPAGFQVFLVQLTRRGIASVDAIWVAAAAAVLLQDAGMADSMELSRAVPLGEVALAQFAEVVAVVAGRR